MTAGRKRCRTTSRTTSRPTPQPEPLRFISYTLPELLALTETDHDELDALDYEPEGMRVWWALRRLEWVEQKEVNDGRS